MKIAIFSDLHIEFGPFEHSVKDAEYVILAGDIGPGLSGIAWAKHNFTANKLELQLKADPFFVPGNHEYYGGRSLISHDKDMREYAKHNGVNYLQNNVWQNDELRIIGSTLWTDFNLNFNPSEAMLNAYLGMADYRQIYYTAGGGYSRIDLQPEHVRQAHLDSINFIEAALYVPFAGKTVVVTHHGCSRNSIHGKYAGHFLNPAFISDLELLIRDTQPDLWVHGHIHNSMDYKIGNTRVLVNPRGYPLNDVGDMENPEFNPGFVIDL